jgi:hypothetical protein
MREERRGEEREGEGEERRRGRHLANTRKQWRSPNAYKKNFFDKEKKDEEG